ncbi:uncharacterized protein LOC102805216 [Saccoglossus kowalevskii]
MVLNLNPQYKSANLGVWVLPSEVSIDGEMEISKEMPAPGESITISRTCEVDGVVPSATITWAYKISSVATSIEGELDKDFVFGDVEDVPEGVNYNVEVKKFSGESDGKFKSNSTITVTFTAADNSDGKVEENLQIEVRCKSKQIGLVEEYERKSNPIKVSVTELMAQTWNQGPSDVQVLEGDDVTFKCKLDGDVTAGLEPRWERIISGTTESTLIATNTAGCNLDNCEYVIDSVSISFSIALTLVCA